MIAIILHILCVTAFMNCFVALNYDQWKILKYWIECPCFHFSLYIRLLQLYFLLFILIRPFKFSSLWHSFYLLCSFPSPDSPFCFPFSYSYCCYHYLSSMNFRFCLFFKFIVALFSLFFILLFVMRILVLLLLFFVLVTAQVGSSSKPSVLNKGGDWCIIPHSY
jgi:hypothetical protein